jgi:hypothetical protein
MTAFATYTPVGIPRYNFNERHVLSAAAALTPGDFYQQADGLLGFYSGLESAALYDPVCFYVTGIYDGLANATTDTWVDGAAVWFDTVTKTFKTAYATNGVYAGTAVGAKVTGTKYVTFALNGNIAPSLSGAATATTLAVSSTSAFTGNVTEAGTHTQTGLLTANGGLTMGGKIARTANDTPVAAAGSAYTDAAAVGAQDIITISSDSAAKGVKLLTGAAGQVKKIINTSATACKLYPATGGTLSGLGANASVTVAASHQLTCTCTAADKWTVIDDGAILAA